MASLMSRKPMPGSHYPGTPFRNCLRPLTRFQFPLELTLVLVSLTLCSNSARWSSFMMWGPKRKLWLMAAGTPPRACSCGLQGRSSSQWSHPPASSPLTAWPFCNSSDLVTGYLRSVPSIAVFLKLFGFRISLHSFFFFNKFIYLFVCLFIFGCVGSSLLRAGFL